MARRISLIGLIAISFVSLTGAAFACSCTRPTPAQYAKWVSTLVEGEIVSTRTKGRWQQTTIRVISVVKGDASLRNQEIVVETRASEAACGYRFPAKGRIIAALRGGGVRFTTGWCTMGPLTTRAAQQYIDAVKASAGAQK